MNVPKLLPRHQKRCDCSLCRRSRKFYRITAKLPLKDREWIRGFYDTVLDTECVLEMEMAAKKSEK